LGSDPLWATLKARASLWIFSQHHALEMIISLELYLRIYSPLIRLGLSGNLTGDGTNESHAFSPELTLSLLVQAIWMVLSESSHFFENFDP